MKTNYPKAAGVIGAALLTLLPILPAYAQKSPDLGIYRTGKKMCVVRNATSFDCLDDRNSGVKIENGKVDSIWLPHQPVIHVADSHEDALARSYRTFVLRDSKEAREAQRHAQRLYREVVVGKECKSLCSPSK